MVEVEVSKKRSVNHYIVKVWQDYSSFSTKEEKKFDRFVPLIISLMLVAVGSIFIKSLSEFFRLLKDFNGISLTVIAILAGFNTASLSVIAASNHVVLGKLYSSKRSGEGDNESNLLQQTISFFGYAILIQLLILIIGAALVFTFSGLERVVDNFDDFFIENLTLLNCIIGLITIPWVSLIFHALFVSVRNVSLLYSYILFVGKASQDEDDEGI